MTKGQEKYLSTKQVKNFLKVRDCDVMHLREAGKIAHVKEGNAYLYSRADAVKLKGEKT